MNPNRNYALLEVNGRIRLVDARMLRIAGPLVGPALRFAEIPRVERKLRLIRNAYARVRTKAGGVLALVPLSRSQARDSAARLAGCFRGRPSEKPALMGLLVLCLFAAELAVMGLHRYLQVPGFPSGSVIQIEDRTRFDLALAHEIDRLYAESLGLKPVRATLIPPKPAFLETEPCYSPRPAALLRIRWPAIKLPVTASVRRAVAPNLMRMPVDAMAFHPMDKESILRAAEDRLGPILAAVAAAPVTFVAAHAESRSLAQAEERGKTAPAPTKHAYPRHGGRLSALFESGDMGVFAIGYDPKGGTSYGKYQFSSRKGSMEMFLEYLDVHAPQWADRLRRAGEANSGYPGGPVARQWKLIAAESPKRFEYLQDVFAYDNYYMPASREILTRTGMDVSRRHGALREVIWSTAVQHGPGGCADIFVRAAQRVREEDASRFNKALVEEIFHERELTTRRMPLHVKSGVTRRLKQEKSMALALLTQPEPAFLRNL